jgi:hypothetical protein
MPKTIKEFQQKHIDWLYGRFQAHAKAQGRYLWLLLVGCLYTFAAHFSNAQTLSVPLVDASVPRFLVEPFATLFLCLMALAFFGTFEAASFQHLLIAHVLDLDWKKLDVHTIDQHPNVLDYLGAAAHPGLKQSRFSLVMNLIAYSVPLSLAVLWIVVLSWEGVHEHLFSPEWLLGVHFVNAALVALTLSRTWGFWGERLRTYRKAVEAFKKAATQVED